MAEEITLSKIILAGPLSKLTERTFLKLKVPNNNILKLRRKPKIAEILQTILRCINDKNKIVLIGLGNTKGVGQNLIEYFSKYGEMK